jgi:ribosomal protection tetracycline resistance protein
LRTLNLGILAHVDAGKTSLTERLLHAVGVTDEIGSVDAGNTHTDSLELERRRGITIKSAVVSFVIDDDLTVNLIDTPGHPDFIAEVERVLGVLDGAVLVVSTVEGVQAQTRVLMRTLRRLRIPALIFVNKVDRNGADCERVLRSIAADLMPPDQAPAVLAMGSVDGAGTRSARFIPSTAADAGFRSALIDLLSERDDELLAAWLDEGNALPHERLHAELAAQTARALVHPVYFGSAITGVGTNALIAGIRDLLPARIRNVDGTLSGTVFKVDRGPAGEKIAYVRVLSGTVRVRDRLGGAKVTAISVFENGAEVRRSSVEAGRIGRLWGLDGVRIGDTIGLENSDGNANGPSPATPTGRQFASPTLETAVVPATREDRGALHLALTQLAEQDPLINLRRDDLRQEVYVSLYGEVQKEVIQATLAEPFPRRCRAASRPRTARRRRGVPLGGRTGLDALRLLRRDRGDREGNSGPGTQRLADRRLHGHADALRLLRAAEPRPRGLRQEHVEHRRGLPQPDSAGADGGTARGGHRGPRTHAPLPARAPDGRSRARPSGAGAAARRPGTADCRWREGRGGGCAPCGSGARTDPATAGPDPG